jgi:IS605 OrfB family transposase
MTALQQRHKQWRLDRLRNRRRSAEASGPKLCFGSRKLFHAQFDLEANGYKDHSEWQKDWRVARAGEIYIVGRNSEPAGNLTCQASFDGCAFSLSLRVPPALEAQFGKHVSLSGIRFHHGTAAILAAISPPDVPATKSHKATAPVTYRFVRPRDGKGWILRVSTHVTGAKVTTRRQAGAIGIDFNADHIAVSHLDRSGNPLPALCESIPLVLDGKTSNQRREEIRLAAKAIAEIARKAGKPIVLEKLDFTEKKRALEAVDPRRARGLSALAFSAFGQAIRAACFRAGVEVIEVNPAWTSVIGSVNYAARFGLSVHLAAAVAIARRGLSFSETPAGSVVATPIRGGHVTFLLPERNRRKHVWSFWAEVSSARKAALAAHFEIPSANRTQSGSAWGMG